MVILVGVIAIRAMALLPGGRSDASLAMIRKFILNVRISIMIWHMQTGDRVLEGFEAEFYLEILQDSFFITLETTDWQYDNPQDFQLSANTGNSFFHRASFNQQVYLINFCLKALLNPNFPMPSLDHLLEAAAFYPFAYLFQVISDEIAEQPNFSNQGNYAEDDQYHYRYRKIAWTAFEELILPSLLENEEKNEEDADEEEEDNEPDFMDLFIQKKHRSNNIKDWEFVVDCLADIIFWDRDWFFVTDWPQYLDGGMEPIRAASMGITENYFTNKLSKVTDEEAMQLLQEIMEWELC